MAALTPPGFTPGSNSLAATTAALTGNVETALGQLTVVKNSLTPGTVFSVRAAGFLQTAAVPGSLTLRMRLTTTSLTGADICSATFTPGASLATNVCWELDGLLGVHAIGAGGTAAYNGKMRVTVPLTTTSWTVVMDGEANRGVFTTDPVYDCTAQQLLEISGLWNSPAAGDTLQLMMFSAVQLS